MDTRNSKAWSVLFLFILLTNVATAQPDRDSAEGQPSANPTALSKSSFIDLTHPFDETTIYWPTEAGFQLMRGSAGITEKGYYYTANRFSAAEHGGTHIDAPIHFSQSGQTVDQIPLEKLVGEAVIIDVTQSCAENRDYQVDISDFRRWETEHRRQLVDVIVLLRTGFSRYWNDRKLYLGTEQRGAAAVASLRFPGLDPDAARWLAEQRSVKAIGIDTASIDFGQSQLFQSHVTLFQHNIPVFENLDQLDKLPLEGATVIALPMKIQGGSGAPLRIIAVTNP